MTITKNTEIILDKNTKNLTDKKYFSKVSGSKKRSLKSVLKRTAIEKCNSLQDDIDNGLILKRN